MPVYEFHCSECGLDIERIYDFAQAPAWIRCECGRNARKIISNSNFILRGSGWPGKELSMGEVVANEKKRDAEYARQKANLKRDGVQFPDWGE